MLRTNELEALRAAQVDAMPDTATIEGLTTVSDGMGGTTETWAVRVVVPVRIGVPSQRGAVNVADRVGGDALFVGTVPAGTDVRRGDRLVVAHADVTATYSVQGVDAPESYDTALRLALQRQG